VLITKSGFRVTTPKVKKREGRKRLRKLEESEGRY
jgi:hypothetical protein